MFCDRYVKLHLDKEQQWSENKLLIGIALSYPKQIQWYKAQDFMIFINILAYHIFYCLLFHDPYLAYQVPMIIAQWLLQIYVPGRKTRKREKAKYLVSRVILLYTKAFPKSYPVVSTYIQCPVDRSVTHDHQCLQGCLGNISLSLGTLSPIIKKGLSK